MSPASSDGSESPKEQSSSSGIARPKIELQYRTLAPGPLAPIVRVEIFGPDNHTLANDILIDSGADWTALPVTWLERLGLTTDDCVPIPIVGACSTGKGWQYEPGLPARAEGIDLHLNVRFTDTEHGMLGRGDFCDAFRVTLDQRAGTLTLEPYPDVVSTAAKQAQGPLVVHEMDGRAAADEGPEALPT